LERVAEWIEIMQKSIANVPPETLMPVEGERIVPRTVVFPKSLGSWLTIERAAYAGLALLALVLRLINLGAHPLSDLEADQALVAWRLLQGQPLEPAGYSPLLVTLNWLSFMLLGASEFTARLGPALLGVVLVLLPYGLRRHLGRAGSLAASALFAISPISLYFSRTVNGEIGTAVGGLALTVGLFGWLDLRHQSHAPENLSYTRNALPEKNQGTEEKSVPNLKPSASRLYLAATGLALMLSGSASTYSVVVLLLGFLALAAAVGDRTYAASAREGLAALRTGLVDWGSFGLLLIMGFLAVATALLFNLGGLAASADLLTAWLLGFVPTGAAFGSYPAVFLLSLYEPLILLAGLFGLAASLLRRRLIDLFIGWWFFGGIALNLLRSGRTDGEVLVPLVPIVLMAGLALGKLWDSVREEGSWQKEGIVLGAGLVISGYVYVSLMTYTRSGGSTVWLPLAGLVLFAMLVALFGIWYDAAASLRGAALSVVVVLLTFMVATGSRLNNPHFTVAAGGRVADPRQPLVHSPAAEGLPALVTTLRQLSGWRTGDPYLLDIVADRRLGPAVEWSLRRFANLTWAEGLDSWTPAMAVGQSETVSDETFQLDEFGAIITPADAPLSLEKGYVGQDFAIRAFWSPGGLRGQSLIRWVVLRTTTIPVSFERAVLWVEAPQGTEIEEEDLTTEGAVP
jgi:4-amino-4-deoxy-L-arabinose transferase-like glycosyltransferase